MEFVSREPSPTLDRGTPFDSTIVCAPCQNDFPISVASNRLTSRSLENMQQASRENVERACSLCHIVLEMTAVAVRSKNYPHTEDRYKKPVVVIVVFLAKKISLLIDET